MANVRGMISNALWEMSLIPTSIELEIRGKMMGLKKIVREEREDEQAGRRMEKQVKRRWGLGEGITRILEK